MGAGGSATRREAWLDERPIGWLAAASWDLVAEETANCTEQDWERLRLSCQVHGLAPLLAARLGPLESTRSELAAFDDWLNVCWRLNVERTARLRSRLREALLACGAAGVEVMVLKGAAVRDRFDTDPTLRPTCDIDLLVAPEDQDRLGEALRPFGYRLDEVKRRHHLYRHEADRALDSPFGEHPDHPICLEAHGRIWVRRLALLEVDLTERFWGLAVDGQVEGLPGTLAAADALLEHLLLNLAGDLVAARARAVQALDLAPVAATLSEAEWERLYASLAERRAVHWAWLSFAMARRLCPLALPAGFEERLTMSTHPAFRAAAERVLWGELSLCCKYRSIETAAWRWATHPGQRAKMACSLMRRAIRGRLARLARRLA